MRVTLVAVAAFVLGCTAHSLTQDVHAAEPARPVCATREEVEELHARVVAIEERLTVHGEIIRAFRAELGLRARGE